MNNHMSQPGGRPDSLLYLYTTATEMRINWRFSHKSFSVTFYFFKSTFHIILRVFSMMHISRALRFLFLSLFKPFFLTKKDHRSTAPPEGLSLVDHAVDAGELRDLSSLRARADLQHRLHPLRVPSRSKIVIYI